MVAVEEDFRDAGGGMGGFLPIGGGGLGFERGRSEVLAAEAGLRLFFNAATLGGEGAVTEGGKGGRPPGGLGALPLGAVGGGALGVAVGGDFLEFVSGSESYRFTPPALFRSFGMPCANNPPSCGAESIPDAAEAAPPPIEPWSLLLRARFCPGGAGGRNPGAGTAGAPPAGGPAFDELPLSMMGADRSLTWVTFFNRAPFSMSPRSAPCALSISHCPIAKSPLLSTFAGFHLPS